MFDFWLIIPLILLIGFIWVIPNLFPITPKNVEHVYLPGVVYKEEPGLVFYNPITDKIRLIKEDVYSKSSRFAQPLFYETVLTILEEDGYYYIGEFD